MKALPFDGATFGDAQISEAGRQFALKLLRPLTRQQLDTLFDTSGVSEYPHLLSDAPHAAGVDRRLPRQGGSRIASGPGYSVTRCARHPSATDCTSTWPRFGAIDSVSIADAAAS